MRGIAFPNWLGRKIKTVKVKSLQKQLIWVFGLILMLVMPVKLWARAGGGHSYHSGGSHSSSSGSGSYSSYHSSGSYSGGGYATGGNSSPFSSLLLLMFIVVVIYFLIKYAKQLQAGNNFKSSYDPSMQNQIRQTLPETSVLAGPLQEKLSDLFVRVQNAWSKGNMEPVRNVISDGVFHRFQLQLEMNKLQGIRNQVEQPVLLQAKFLKEEVFGNYVSVDFHLRARVMDKDISLSDGQVVSCETTPNFFEEIWSFTRQASLSNTNSENKIASESCPKCGAQLADAGGSRCSHCGAVLNAGTYDWVLAEITQPEEWVENERHNLLPLYAGLPQLPGGSAESWLSPQELEDRASVVFIRFQMAIRKKQFQDLNMFASSELLQKWEREKTNLNPLFHLAVGAVDLLSFAATEGMMMTWVRVKYSGSENPQHEGEYRENILVFCKELSAPLSKAGLSSSTCSSCGAPLESSDQAKCAYCGNVFSSPAANWVLRDLGGPELLPRKLNAYTPDENKNNTGPRVQLRMLSAIIGAALDDGIITREEENVIRDFARHFGVGEIFVDNLLRRAHEDPSSLMEKMSAGEAERWMTNFVIVAATDGSVTSTEEALLLAFARQQGFAEQKVRFALQNATNKRFKK